MAADEGLKLTARQRAVLADIASSDPATGGFPPRNTVLALIKRGLVCTVQVTEPQNPFEMLMGRHLLRLDVTDAGRAVMATSRPTPAGGETGEGGGP